jgi:hypothetical protein
MIKKLKEDKGTPTMRIIVGNPYYIVLKYVQVLK